MGSCFTLLFAVFILIINSAEAANGKVFREYIGAESESLRLADVPINPKSRFISSFRSLSTTPRQITLTKQRGKAFFAPGSPETWVRNAMASLTQIIKEYHIDGLDIDYEHFKTNPSVFADCIGRLVTTLKQQKHISFASIAPFEEVQSHYLALWNKYGNDIDYVNFQFYAYNRLGVSEFKRHFDEQVSKYQGGSIMASIISKGSGGLRPEQGFFDACRDLKKEGKLGGIFIWCADESQGNHFSYEIQSQALLAA
ncbi:hypothetical protein MLD38_017322 [Melastoma candidum]|uniref:Uncharacterized protein n=1 Tax=Melastoma candidum TaxID=119954 RepID=A0ACB9QUA8_9MYRT|nr:hypothetical protein MLD38_017322 [Melastoma candidum]